MTNVRTQSDLVNGTSTPSSPARKINPLRSLQEHAVLSMFIFLVLVTIGFPLAWKKGKRTYTVEAVVYVSPRFPKNLDDDKEFELQSNSQYREFVQQNVRTVGRYDILAEAIEKLERDGHSFRERAESIDHAISRLRASLKVLPVPDTYQITIDLEGEKPDGLAETVNTIVASFLEKSKEEDFYGRDQRLASLRQEEHDLRTEIESFGRKKDTIAQKLGVSVFSESFSNPFDQLLIGSKQALASARQKRIVSEAQLSALERSAAAGAPTGFEAYAGEMSRRDSDITSLQSNLNFRRNELLSKLDGMLPNHPARSDIEAQLRQLDEVSQSKRKDLEQAYASILVAQRKAELTADTQTERELQKQVDQQAAQAVWYSQNYQAGINIRYEIERARNRLEAVQNRVDFLEQEGRAPGFSRLFSAARPPTEPVSGGRKKPVLMLAALAVAVAIAVPLGLDYVDPRLLTIEDVERSLGFPVMGYTVIASSETDINDRVRRLAAAIEREFTRNSSRSFVFVGINSVAPIAGSVSLIAEELWRMGHDVEAYGWGLDLPIARAAAAGSSSFGRTSKDAGTNPLPFGTMRKWAVQSAERGRIVLISAQPFAADPETELLASSCDVVVLAVPALGTRKAELRTILKTLQNLRPKAVAAIVISYDPRPRKTKIDWNPLHMFRIWPDLKPHTAESEAVS